MTPKLFLVAEAGGCMCRGGPGRTIRCSENTDAGKSRLASSLLFLETNQLSLIRLKVFTDKT